MRLVQVSKWETMAIWTKAVDGWQSLREGGTDSRKIEGTKAQWFGNDLDVDDGEMGGQPGRGAAEKLSRIRDKRRPI